MRGLFVITCLLLFFIPPVMGQRMVVKGLADAYKGKTISLYTYDDLVTYTEKKIADTIVNENGRFELLFENNEIRYAFLRAGKQTASIYLQPGKTYDVYFPPRDTVRFLNPDVEQKVNLIFKSVDSTDINGLIMNYNRHFDTFWRLNYQYFVAKRSRHKLDSFRIDMNKIYANIKNNYFSTYLDYSIGVLDENTFHNRGKLTELYITGKPVREHSYEYMSFFNNYFKGYFLTKEGQHLQELFKTGAAYKNVMEKLKQDGKLSNDTLRELVLLKGIMELYYVPECHYQEQLITLAQHIQLESPLAEHRKIARNALQLLTRMRAGTAAPSFLLSDKNGKSFSLEEFKGKYVYLDFWATWCTPCLQEMKLVPELKKKYGANIVFISISIDKDKATMVNFLEKNPKYDWVLLHYERDERLKEFYNVKAIPLYFLIDPDGNFVNAPALRPGEGIDALFDKLAPTQKKKVRIGEK